MKRKFLVMVALLAMALVAAPAMATVTPYNESGVVGGYNVTATATFTTFDNGDVKVEVYNTTANPTSIIQEISDLAFILSDGTLPGSLVSSLGTSRTVNISTNLFTDNGKVTTGWGLDPYPGGSNLNVLGHLAPPFNLIIGPPEGGFYSNANASINTHNPQLFGTALDPVVFNLHFDGVTSETTVDFARFSWGTGGDIAVPIPPTALLMGSGLLGLGLIGWRRRK